MKFHLSAPHRLRPLLFLSVLVVTISAHAASGALTAIYSFAGGVSGLDGANPSSGLIRANDGNFYGTTVYGGSASSSGTVFKLSPGGAETVLFSFNGTDGANPTDLVQGSDGNLYGTTYWGGPNNGYGTVYKITTQGLQTVLYDFTAGGDVGTNPTAGLVEGVDGNFYGTTTGGGQGFGGTVFRITPAGELTVLHALSGTDGSAPGKLTLGRDGNFYGVAAHGGAGSYGTVFRMTPQGDFTVLYSFTGSPDGANPNGPLLEASDGSFYGVTSGGGTGPCSPILTTNCGTVFKITPAGQETVLHSFSGPPDDGTASCVLCSWSSEGLTEGPDGNLYGVTLQGGSYTQGNCSAGCGTLFSITPTGQETVLHSFVGPWSTPSDGWAPTGSLLQISPGVFWGTEFYGVSGWGSVFQFTVVTASISAKPTSIRLGRRTILTWSSTNATSCAASGAWSGSRAVNGSAIVKPAAVGPATYTLTCSGPAGSANLSTTVIVRALPPTVTISAGRKHVAPDQSVQLNWHSTDAADCTAEGAWNGDQAPSGQASVTPPKSGLNVYALKCTGPGGSRSAFTFVIKTS